jgi:hypothetical protein
MIAMLESHPLPMAQTRDGQTVVWLNLAARAWWPADQRDTPAGQRLSRLGLSDAALADRAAGTIDARLLSPDGVERWCRFTLGPVQADGLRLISWQAHEASAHEALERLRRLELAVQAAGLGYWSMDRGGKRPTWSRQLHRIHGHPVGAPPPTIAEYLDHWVHRDDRAALRDRLRQFFKSAQAEIRLDYRVVRPDGQCISVLANMFADDTVHDRHAEGERALMGVIADVTERRAAEAALRRADDRAALIARGVGLGTWETDPATGLADWDEQMWALRGMAPRATPLTAEEKMALVHPDDRGPALASFDKAIQTLAPLDHEFRILHTDGQWRWISSRSVAVLDERGRLLRRIGVNWDSTEAHAAAVERQERMAAQRALQANLRFLSRMSHELRTPLNAVLGYAQLMQADIWGTDADTRQRRLGYITTAGRHLLSLIDDVLDLARMDGGELSVSLQSTPLEPLIQAALPLTEPLARTYQVNVLCGQVAGTVHIDPTRLRQALLNLLTNAIKYNRKGGWVRVSATSETDGVVLCVEDSGRGMTEEHLQRLFEPFNRLGAERTSVEGTGLGLSIAKSLIERMGGTIHVASTLGVGTRFSLRLPHGQADAQVEASALPTESPPPVQIHWPSPAKNPGQTRTLLYIEDNSVNSALMQELMVLRPDVQLLLAETGEAGLALAAEHWPDLIVLDMQLPDLHGTEVFARLRADAVTASIPCIALSANVFSEDITSALDLGFADYWTKPLDLATFQQTLEAVFGPSPVAWLWSAHTLQGARREREQ